MTSTQPVGVEDGHASPTAVDYLTRWGLGDVDGAAALLADDAVWVFPGHLPISGTHRGRDAVAALMRRISAGADDGTFAPEITCAFESGERVALEWHSTATAGGRPYESSYAGVFEVRDGRIATFHEYLDTTALVGVFDDGSPS